MAVIFKQTTHSLIEDFHGALQGKEELLLGILGTYGAKDLLTGSLNKKNLDDLYNKLPDSIKDKIKKGNPLSRTEENKEVEIIRREFNIPMRTLNQEGRGSLEALNNLYRESNPVGGTRKPITFRKKK